MKEVSRLLLESDLKAKPLARPPVAMDGAVGANIGKVLEVELPGLEFRANDYKPDLIWFPIQKSLGFFVHEDGDHTKGRPEWMKIPRSGSEYDYLDEIMDLAPADKAFKTFMGRGPDMKARSISFPDRSTRGWYSIDRAIAIGYWSDKQRRKVNYTHKFGSGVRLYIYGSPRRYGPSFWLIRGGDLKITERGLIN